MCLPERLEHLASKLSKWGYDDEVTAMQSAARQIRQQRATIARLTRHPNTEGETHE